MNLFFFTEFGDLEDQAMSAKRRKAQRKIVLEITVKIRNICMISPLFLFLFLFLLTPLCLPANLYESLDC